DIVTTTNDRMASSGSFDAEFKRTGRNRDACGKANADIFHVNGRPARTVEPRNTPTTINAVFNHRNFWDGRAKNIFNGKGVFGRSEIANDPTARVIEWDGSYASLVPFEIDHASLASQAVGPPLSNLEMSCDTRTFADVGNKMLVKVKRPLFAQKIAHDDSMFGDTGPKGNVIHRRGKGLKFTYEQLVKKAFHEKYWDADGRFIIKPDGTLRHDQGGIGGPFADLASLVDGVPFADELLNDRKLGKFLSGYRRHHHGGKGYSQMEQNFSLFFGLAVMLYESELISDQSRFDAASAKSCFIVQPQPAGPPRQVVAQKCIDDGTLTEKQADGFALFSNFGRGGAGCVACHGGPLFSDAVAFVDADDNVNDPFADNPLVQQFGVSAFHDDGFHNIGSRPVYQDLGIGAGDPWGQPLSVARQAKREAQTGQPPADGLSIDVCDIPRAGPPGSPVICPDDNQPPADDLRLVIDGGMKTPGLRNVALTPPYFHYGGYSTLEQVVEFYARGGSNRDKELVSGDDSGTGPTGDSGAIDADKHPFVDDGSFGTNSFLGAFNPAIDPDNGKDRQYGIEAIADFMRTMTDERVQCDAAPFDHPSLKVPNGHKRNGRDHILKIPAVGKNGAGGTAYGCLPNAGDLFAIQTRVDPTDPDF
ncbi:MAG: cytochrome c peroxidase, partial [Geminicoccaceae bacterium]